ncbi:MAG TPA: LCP family protein, partial [Thermomicrobiales bacterium]|nr:LCP family protein [Thermomicrobiales bacterium]
QSTSTSAPEAMATDEPAEELPTDDPTTVPSEEAASLPTAPATEVPTEAATATDVVPTPEPEPTVTLSQIERIKNGSFEEGNEGWYLESEARSVETAAVSGTHALLMPRNGSWADQGVFFLNGTTYHLSVWGKTTTKGDPAQIGVTFADANGERMRDLEPAPLEFAALEYTQQTLTFTVPDGVATVKVFVWNGNVTGDFYVDDVSVRSEIPPSDLEPAETSSDGGINMLVMGVDARPGEAIDIGVRPDSLMVVRLNPETGSCRTLAIPRDTRTELPGYGQTKINHALAVGGIPYQQQVVENLLGLKIDHYVLIDFDGFQDLVDAVGGVKVNGEEPFAIDQDIWFEAGEQTMDGKHALAYARYRGGPDGDFGRIARQQQILRALIRKASKLNVVRSLNELLPAVESNIRTDLEVKEMARLGLDYRDTCTDESVEMLRLEGYDAWLDDPLLNMPLLYVVVDEAEIRAKVAMLKEG